MYPWWKISWVFTALRNLRLTFTHGYAFVHSWFTGCIFHFSIWTIQAKKLETRRIPQCGCRTGVSSEGIMFVEKLVKEGLPPPVNCKTHPVAVYLILIKLADLLLIFGCLTLRSTSSSPKAVERTTRAYFLRYNRFPWRLRRLTTVCFIQLQTKINRKGRRPDVKQPHLLQNASVLCLHAPLPRLRISLQFFVIPLVTPLPWSGHLRW